MPDLLFADDPRPLAVIGGTGMLGRPVARRLASEGARVRIIGRDATRARAELGDGFDYAVADVRDPAALGPALAGCRAVHINLSGGPDVQVQGVAAIVAAAAANGLERVTIISGAGMEAGDPSMPFVQVKQAAEAAVMAGATPWTILRPTHFMESLDFFVRGDCAEIPGPQPNPYHYLAADDYAGQVARVLASPEAARQALVLLGPEPFAMADALRVYVRHLRPELTVRETQLAELAMAAERSGDPRLGFMAQLFGTFQRLPETGDREAADVIVGRATTTLAQWCERRRVSEN